MHTNGTLDEFAQALNVLATSDILQPSLHVNCCKCLYSRRMVSALPLAKQLASTHSWRKMHRVSVSLDDVELWAVDPTTGEG